MKWMAVVVACLVSAPAFAATDADWTMYGDTDAAYCFYDSANQKRLPGAHVQVSTKCLDIKQVAAVDIEKDDGGQIMQEAVEKVARFYVPPWLTVHKVPADQLANRTMDIILREEIADLSPLQPVTRILYEIDCPQARYRALSIDPKDQGQAASTDAAQPWQSVAAETNLHTLMALTCPVP